MNMARLDEAINDLIDVLVEEEICDVVNERGHDYLFLFGKDEDESNGAVDPERNSVNAPNVDIFGQVLGKKATFEIQCPNCKRTLAAVRFAPHLEKCMGMGRNSSRIASRRLAAAAGNNSSSAFASAADVQRVSTQGSTTTPTSLAVQINGNNGDNVSDDDHFEDIDDDEDWTMEKKRRSKRPVEKTSSRR